MMKWNFRAQASALQGGKRSWRLNQLSLVNDLINHTYVMTHPKILKELGLECFWIGENVEIQREEGGMLRETMEAPHPFPHTLPQASLTSGVPKLYSFLINW